MIAGTRLDSTLWEAQVCATEVRVLEGARKLAQSLSLAELLPDDAEVAAL